MESDFRYANFGTNFDSQTGKLFMFEGDRITVATCWPKPMAWRKTSSSGWRNLRLTRRDFRLTEIDLESEIHRLEIGADIDGQIQFRFMLSRYDYDELARLRWYAQIPAEIRRLLIPFHNRQWHLLSMLARCGSAAADLVVSSPALAFALASNWVFHRPAVKRPLRSIRCLLQPGKKQKDILAWLGFPNTKSARRILARVIPQCIDVNPLLYLRQALGNPQLCKLLTHTARLNAGALRIATDPRLAAYVTPRLIEEVSQNRNEDLGQNTANLLRDCMIMYDPDTPQIPGAKISSLADLNRLHDDLIDDFNSRPAENLKFPQPPIAGNSEIIPITSPKELWAEGNEMRHCVASYARSVATQSDVFIYKVVSPERCTLKIQRSQKSWHVGELRGLFNRLVSPETLRLVQSWLAGSQSLKSEFIRTVK